MEWDARTIFQPDDYLYFYRAALTETRSDAEADTIWSLAALQPGSRVLDLPCGHGRLTNRLAARGAVVVGMDVTPGFLEIARGEASERALTAEYVEGDMRAIPWTGGFDCVVNWFTSFGYFDDATDRQVLAGMHDALRPGGLLLMELQHGPALLRAFLPATVTHQGEDSMTDEHRFDAATGRIHTTRTILRNGRVRSAEFSTRVFAFPELRDWLHSAGFSTIEPFDGTGNPLDLSSRRLVVRATRSS